MAVQTVGEQQTVQAVQTVETELVQAGQAVQTAEQQTVAVQTLEQTAQVVAGNAPKQEQQDAETVLVQEVQTESKETKNLTLKGAETQNAEAGQQELKGKEQKAVETAEPAMVQKEVSKEEILEYKEKLNDFLSYHIENDETVEYIKKCYEDNKYLIDPHTAVAYGSYLNLKEELKGKTCIVSTASPYKFTRSVMNSIDAEYDKQSDFDLVDELNRLSGVKVPQAIEDIRTAPVRHNTVCDKEDMLKVVKEFLGV